MRVLIIASGDLWAGAEVMIFQLICELNKIKQVDLLVVLLNKGRLEQEIRAKDVKVKIINEMTHSFFSIIHEFREIIYSFSPEVIHSHRYKENMAARLAAIGYRHIKLVATQHGMPEINRDKKNGISRLKNFIFFRLLSSYFDRTVAVSREMKNTLVECHGFSDKKVTVIHNGIPIHGIACTRERQRVIVGSAGRLFAVKDYSLMVDIAKSVIAKSEVVDFVIAGDGPEYSMLNEKIEKYGLEDRFKMIGHQDNMDAFFRGIDIYINTSMHEGIPMSVLEAMSYKLPVVVPEVGGFPEIVENNVNGFLVSGRDPEIFAKKVLKLIQPDFRKKMAIAAKQRVETNFSSKMMARAYYQLYKELL